MKETMICVKKNEELPRNPLRAAGGARVALANAEEAAGEAARGAQEARAHRRLRRVPLL